MVAFTSQPPLDNTCVDGGGSRRRERGCTTTTTTTTDYSDKEEGGGDLKKKGNVVVGLEFGNQSSLCIPGGKVCLRRRVALQGGLQIVAPPTTTIAVLDVCTGY